MQATAGARREQLESMLAYPEDSAGGLMNADAIAVRADVKAGTVLRYLRLLDTLPPQTDTLMVVDARASTVAHCACRCWSPPTSTPA